MRLSSWPSLLLMASLSIAQQYPFLPVPGTPSEVRIMLQDHLGRLWLGTFNDVECFDGIRFYSLHEFGFPSVGATKIAEDSEGGILIASGAGVHRFYQGRLEEVIRGFAMNVAAIAPGIVLAAVGKTTGIPVNPTLLRIQQTGKQWRTDRLMELSFEGQFTLDRNRKVVYLCPGGWCDIGVADLVNWRAGKPLAGTRHQLPITLAGSNGMVLRDRFGCVWVRSDTKSYYQCPHDPKPVEMPLNSNAALIRERADGEVMIPASGTLTIGRPGAFRVLSSRNGLPVLGDVMIARDGTMWLGSAGLVRWASPWRMEFWTEREGIDDGVWSVARMHERMFIAAGGRILRLSDDRSRWERFASSQGLGIIQNLMAGPNGSIFAATRQSGVVLFDSKGRLIARPEPAGTMAMMLARTPDGQLWASGAGIMRVEQIGNRLLTKPDEVPGVSTRAIDMEVDHSGKLWACSDGGLVSKEPSGWHRITMADGLLENGCRSFAITSKGDVWYGYHGTAAFSLIQFDAQTQRPHITHFRSGGNIGNADIIFFNEDRRGWLWRGTAEAIHVADPTEAKTGKWIQLDMRDGLPAPGGNQQAFFDDPDGSIWFGADRTVVHLTPSPDFARPTTAPQVFISGFSWNGRPPLLADAVSTLPRDADIVAYLGSLQFDRRSALRFRYRLLPIQKSWQETRSFDVRLGRLRWGLNTLEVQARLSSSPWSAVASKSFSVASPVWLTWQFLALVIGSGLALSAGGFGWRKLAGRTVPALPDLTGWRMTALEPVTHELVGKMPDRRYEVGVVIARGGFGAVLDARDLDQNRRCAIKVFRRDAENEAAMKRAFVREVKALERIRHPNVVRIYGHGATPSGSLYLVMEFVEGATLRKAIQMGGLSRERIADLLLQMGEALGELHAQRIYHRDLKPENVMLRASGSGRSDLVLVDFSIAIIKDPNETIPGITKAEGSIEYMAPEQLLGYADEATDIYSLARIVIELMTGKRLALLLPHASLDLSRRVRELLTALPFPLSATSIDLLSTALEFHPMHRPHDAVGFSRRIAADLGSGPVTLKF